MPPAAARAAPAYHWKINAILIFERKPHMKKTLRTRPVLRRLLPVLLVLLAGSVWSCQPHKPDPAPRTLPAPPEKPPTERPYKVLGQHYTPISSAAGFREKGIASWYGHPFHGRKTASGEIYNMHAHTAAHRILPMGTFLRVRNLENQREIIVRINDRGPFVKNRIIDLSYRSATEIGMIEKGTAPVEITAVKKDSVALRDGMESDHPDFFTGNFSVQVGAYADRDRADAIGKRLREFEKEVFITRASMDGKSIYRVRVGRFASRQRAEELKHRLSKNGYKNVFTVSGGP